MKELKLDFGDGIEVANVPEEWGELSVSQLTRIAPLLTSEDESDQTYLKLLKVFLNLSDYRFSLLCDLLINEEHNQSCSILDLYPLVEWLYDKDLSSFESALPYYEGFEGVKTNFEGLTFVQYIVADPLFHVFTEDRELDVLNRLCAVLYVKKGHVFDGDSLPWLNEMVKVSTDVKKAMVLNFMVMRKWFASCFPLLHATSEEEDDDSSYDLDWGRNLIHELPNEKFGSLMQIRQTPAVVIFDYLERLKEKSYAD